MPHILVLDMNTIPGAGFGTAASASVTAIVEGDGELVVVGAAAVGFEDLDPAADIIGLGDIPGESPDGWPATVMVSEERGGLRLSDKQVRVSAMFGSGKRPCRWPVPWVLPPGAEVRVAATQFWDVANRAQFLFYGFKRPPHSDVFPAWASPDTDVRLRALLRGFGGCSVSPFWYGFSFDQAATRSQNQAETRHVTVSGFDFAGLNLYAGFDDPGDGTGYFLNDTGVTEQEQVRGPAATAELRVTTNQMRLALDNGAVRLHDRPAACVAIAGTGRRPGLLARPLLVSNGRSISATVQFSDASLTANTAVRGYITIGGARVNP